MTRLKHLKRDLIFREWVLSTFCKSTLFKMSQVGRANMEVSQIKINKYDPVFKWLTRLEVKLGYSAGPETDGRI